MPSHTASKRMTTTVKSGSLQKRSQNKGRFTAENYKRRYFVLNKTHFKYYDGNSGEVSMFTYMSLILVLAACWAA